MHADPYLIPGTDCLANKLGITNQDRLSVIEGDVVFARDLALSRWPLPGRYDAAHLCRFHARLFGDVYPWAGRFRTVRISKGGTDFGPPQFVPSEVAALLSDLREQALLIGLRPRPFIEKLSYFYGELNSRHPFREGNGRTQRAFWRQLAAAAVYRVDWSALSPEANNEACRQYHFRQDVNILVKIIEPITAQIPRVNPNDDA